ncbi:cell surface A33 antigen [Danio aesculapii]|uniref:cell surface A33 antigen n=1 Tax=Danio aesculapii TaxID=1142201 RepID=UPI0024C018D6|nr:cell surface A33 antigen [Danio aesculapii]
MTNWKLIFCSLCLISVMSATFGLEVTMSQASMEVARGDDVRLMCTFKPKKPENDLIIVTWIGDADETSGDKVLFGNYYSNTNKVDIDPQYVNRVSIETDLTTKTSTLTIKQVTQKESRKIRCYVQIPGDIEGKPADTTFLLVQVAPSQPVCKVVGTAEYGHNISLTCVSEEGSPVPTYKWERYSVKNVPQGFPIKTTEKDGVLSLVNVSSETSGYYICLSSNKVGSAKCNMTLSILPPSMNLATIGIVAGCVAGAVVLLIVIICCCRKRKQKQKLKEYQMEKPAVEYHDNSPLENIDERNIDTIAITDERTGKARNDNFEDRYDDSGSGRDDFRGRENHKGSRDELRDRNDDRRGSRDELRDRNDDRRGSHDELRDRYEDRRGSRDELRDRYEDRRGSRDELRDRYEDRRGSRDELRERYDDRRDQYDDRRDQYDDRRDHYDDRRGSRDDLRDRYDDRRDRYDDRKGSRDDLRDRYR